MKKYLFLFVMLLTISASAQIQFYRLNGAQREKVFAGEDSSKTTDLLPVREVVIPWTYQKRISGVADTAIINPGMNYKYLVIGIVDSNDTATDTLKVLYKSAITGNYTSALMGFIELLTNDPIANNEEVVPGQGKEKQYLVNRVYPGAVYITWKTTAGKTTRKCRIYAYAWSK